MTTSICHVKSAFAAIWIAFVSFTCRAAQENHILWSGNHEQGGQRVVRMVHDEVVYLDDDAARRILEQGGSRAEYTDAVDTRPQRLVRSANAESDARNLADDSENHQEGVHVFNSRNTIASVDSQGNIEDVTPLHRRHGPQRPVLQDMQEHVLDIEDQTQFGTGRRSSEMSRRVDIDEEQPSMVELQFTQRKDSVNSVMPLGLSNLLQLDQGDTSGLRHRTQAGMVTAGFLLVAAFACIGLVGFKVFRGSSAEDENSTGGARGSNAGRNRRAIDRQRTNSGVKDAVMKKMSNVKDTLSGRRDTTETVRSARSETNQSYSGQPNSDLFGHMVN